MRAIQEGSTRPGRAWRDRDGLPLVLLLAAVQLVAFGDRFLITLVAQPLKVDLGLSDAQLGLVQGSAFALVNALAMPGMGVLADRGHRRALLVASLVVWGSATFACGLADTFVLLLGARALLGLGQAAITPVALSLLSDRLPRHRLGRGISWFTAGGSIGRSSALLLGGTVLAWMTLNGGFRIPGMEAALPPWRALFILACLPNVLLLVGALRIVEPSPAPPARDARLWAWMHRRRAQYLPLFGTAVAAVLIGQTLTAWIPTFYVRVHHLTPAESGIRIGLLVLVAAPAGHLTAGRLLDRWRARGRRRPGSLILAAALALTGPAVAVTALASDLSVSLTALTALVALLGMTSAPILARLQILTPRAFRGRVNALFVSGVTLIAFGLGPVLVGVLNDRVFGTEGVGLAMLTVFIPVSALGSVLALVGGTVRAPSRPDRSR